MSTPSRPTTPILRQPGGSDSPSLQSAPLSKDSSRQGITIEEPDHPRSSFASHRNGIVGDGTYGGRKGGPSMLRSRTSSSGGLSDIKAGYERRVGFDTMPDADETSSGVFSFTLQVKSSGYQRTKNTRTFMCAVDDNPYRCVTECY